MSEASVPSPPLREARRPSGERRWPAWVALFTAGFLPATTAKRTTHVGLLKAFGVHLVAGVVTVMVFLVMAECYAVFYWWPGTVFCVADVLVDISSDIARLFDDSCAGLLTPLVAVLLVELLFLGDALLLTAWGARDERVRGSFRNALQRVWLHTPHAVVVVLLCGLCPITLDHLSDEWWLWHDKPTLPESPTTPRDPEAPEWQRFDEQYELYLKQKDAYSAAFTYVGSRPWFVKYEVTFSVLSNCVGVVWWLWALFRWVGAPRPARRVARPPLCETCGYNLTAAPVGGRCPECGVPVAESLGPRTRPGAPWEHRERGWEWLARWRCTVRAIARPGALGRQLRMADARTEHRRFLYAHLALLFWVGWFGFLLCCIADYVEDPFRTDPKLAWAIGPLMGCITAGIGAFLASGAAGVVGLVYRVRHRRNVLAASMQMACYVSGLVVVWAVVVFGATAGVAAGSDWLSDLDRNTRVSIVRVVLGLWWAVNLMFFVCYAWLVAKGTSAAKYANT